MDSIAWAFVVMGVLLFGAMATDQKKELCAAMGGTYRDVAPPADQCPGGKWSNLLFKAAPTK